MYRSCFYKSFKRNIMNLKKLKVLLADDDVDDCMFFKRALEDLSLATNLTTVHDEDQLMSYLVENAEHLPHVLFSTSICRVKADWNVCLR